jgi:hypothetical protein
MVQGALGEGYFHVLLTCSLGLFLFKKTYSCIDMHRGAAEHDAEGPSHRLAGMQGVGLIGCERSTVVLL